MVDFSSEDINLELDPYNDAIREFLGSAFDVLIDTAGTLQESYFSTNTDTLPTSTYALDYPVIITLNTNYRSQSQVLQRPEGISIWYKKEQVTVGSNAIDLSEEIQLPVWKNGSVHLEWGNLKITDQGPTLRYFHKQINKKKIENMQGVDYKSIQSILTKERADLTEEDCIVINQIKSLISHSGVQLSTDFMPSEIVGKMSPSEN
jgi:hypothetical protein